MDKKSEGLIADLAGLKLELDTLKAKGVNTLMYSLLKQKYQEKYKAALALVEGLPVLPLTEN
ncbi:hypothetical protein N5K35_28570 [Pseudomonas sp. GD03651]|uniref:Uncharacterized protein n=2 Tax=Pseudomonas putida TaxID=303 RepID=A0A2S3WKM1_PSEPU|nr:MULTISPECIES: hypothetical protein [Pseudomonas]HCF2574676.1 hypothetical protein [Pseudomonas aeruginosa]AGN82383.1 hypothetical protein L483_15690 [Pseudomonas putida H8234]ELS0927147.1 hypothetical protein [Pseudomonas putida]ENY77260.1 hypothetical protein C206_13039 [Pseudomonas putida TRO1]KYC18836.1 hypothetical protein WM94_19120 [Pseudomonas sp. ABFPK]